MTFGVFRVASRLRLFGILRYIGFEVFIAVYMNAAIFWDISQRSPYVNRHFGRSISSIFRVEKQLCKKAECSRWLYRIRYTVWYLFSFLWNLLLPFSSRKVNHKAETN